MAWDIYVVHVFVATRIAILKSLLFCKFDRCFNSKSSLSSDAASWLYMRGVLFGVI
jgi:hypothetical protein